MNKKNIMTGLIGLLLLASIFAVSVTGENLSKTKPQGTTILGITEELDQFQNDTIGIPLGVGRINFSEEVDLFMQVAQSFVPTKSLLTRVELFIAKNETASEPYTLAIRDNLSRNNIVESTISPENINTWNISDPDLNFSWIEFDFDDIFVEVGETYYIVCYTENVTENWYIWGSNNDSSSYEFVDAWISYDEGDTWTNQSRSKNTNSKPKNKGIRTLEDPNDNRSDMCFKTYGADATELNLCIQPISRNFKFQISNKGPINATDVEYNITIKGGIFSGINITLNGTINNLQPDHCVHYNAPLFGLGPVTVNATIEASNTKIIQREFQGFIFFRLLLFPPITIL